MSDTELTHHFKMLSQEEVLKDGSLPSVWQEVKGLMSLDTKGENRHKQMWQGRQQTFRWVNGVEHDYGFGLE